MSPLRSSLPPQEWCRVPSVRKPGVKDFLKCRDVQSHGSEVGGVGTTSVQDYPRCVAEGVGGGSSDLFR